MMKKIIVVFCIVFLVLPSFIFAADVHLRWDASKRATGYKIYRSEDGGNTWSAGTDVGNVLEATLIGEPENKLVLYKVGAYNANGEAIPHWRGAWYDGRKKPPGLTTGVGIY